MSPRDFLLLNGATAKDLEEAVEDSRKVVYQVKKWSALAETIFLQAEKRAPEGKNIVKLFVSGRKVASVVNETATEMLAKRRRQP